MKNQKTDGKKKLICVANILVLSFYLFICV